MSAKKIKEKDKGLTFKIETVSEPTFKIENLDLPKKDKMTKTQIFALIGAIGLFILLCLFLSNFKFITYLFKISLSKNLGSSDIALVFFIAVILLVIFLAIMEFFWLINFLDWRFFPKNHRKQNFWGIAMALVMLFIFIFGFISYYNLFSQKDLMEILVDSNGNPHAVINCTSPSKVGNLIENMNISCSVEPSINLSGGYISQKHENSMIDYVSLNNSIIFISKANITEISFNLQIINHTSNSTYNLSANKSYHFYSAEENKSEGIKFLKFLILLLGVIFITIPTSFYYMREIFKN
jgi:hypothetical protein